MKPCQGTLILMNYCHRFIPGYTHSLLLCIAYIGRKGAWYVISCEHRYQDLKLRKALVVRLNLRVQYSLAQLKCVKQ